MYEMEFKYTLFVVVEKSIYQQSYSQTKTKTSHLLSPNRDPCVTILSVTVCMLYSSS